jgi:hypothetical protein
MEGAGLAHQGSLAIPIARLGAPLRRRFEAAPTVAGRVHSCFTRCFNVEWHDGGLVAFQGAGPLAAPFAASLAWLPAAGRLRPGAPVCWRGGRLHVDHVEIDAREADWTDVSITPAPGGVRVLSEIVVRHASTAEVAPALRSAVAHEAGACLARGIRDDDPEALVAGARGLIGLGEGLTPAGDDCLVGVLAVLHRWAPRLARDGAVGSALGRAAQVGTTAIARAFLTHALAGCFSEPVIALVTAPSPDAAARAAADLCGLGATSGADTLAGMSLALRALDGIAP